MKWSLKTSIWNCLYKQGIMKNKKLENTKMLKKYGSWIYCTNCNNTVGYLCYTTYDYFKLSYTCKCGITGSVEIGELSEYRDNNKDLLKKKNRYCCPLDDSPLFSVVDKHISKFNFFYVCKSCKSLYTEKAI